MSQFWYNASLGAQFLGGWDALVGQINLAAHFKVEPVWNDGNWNIVRPDGWPVVRGRNVQMFSHGFREAAKEITGSYAGSNNVYSNFIIPMGSNNHNYIHADAVPVFKGIWNGFGNAIYNTDWSLQPGSVAAATALFFGGWGGITANMISALPNTIDDKGEMIGLSVELATISGEWRTAGLQIFHRTKKATLLSMT